MLFIEPIEKRKYTLYKSEVFDHVEGAEKIADLSLIAHSVSNKFHIVGDLISEMCDEIDGFENWFYSMTHEYLNAGYNAEVLINNAESFYTYSAQYIEYKEINFDKFINLDKKSSTSIVFYPDDIKAISTASTCLKLYSMFSCDMSMRLPDNLHKKMYKLLIQPCIDSDVTTKIFQLIRSRTYRSSLTDRYMWDFIKMMISETPESYVMTVFNFLMKSILTLINVDQNPIPFLISTIDDSIRYLMRSVYKDKIIYGEVFGGVEDLFGSALTKENFYLFCCQDVVGKGAKIGLGLLEDNYELDDPQYEAVRERLDSLSYLYPSSLLVILPIVSKVLEVPYKFLLTIPPKHAMLLGLFMYELSKDILDERFPILVEFLIACPDMRKSSNVNTTRSSYKIRNLELILNDPNLLFGFASKTLKFDVMSSIAGVLSASKRVLVNLVNGKPLSKMTYYNLESDVCGFFSELYANKLDGLFEQMREKADVYF